MRHLAASTERNVHDNILGAIGDTPLVRLAAWLRTTSLHRSMPSSRT